MDLPIELQHFLESKAQFNEAFQDVSFEKTSWGSIFEFPKIHYINQNFMMILNDTKEGFPEIIKWINQEVDRKILVKNGTDFNENLKKIGKAYLISRKKQKIRFPILEFGLIQTYSYRNNFNIETIRSLIPTICNFAESEEGRRPAVEKLLGGLLHLLNGTIWTYELDDGNVITAVLESNHDEIRETRFIDFISTRENFRSKGYALLLIQAMISENWKHNFIALIPEELLQFTKKFGFEIISEFDVYL